MKYVYLETNHWPARRVDLERGWSFKQQGAGIGIVLTTLERSIIKQSFTFGFFTSNKEAEYKAVLVRLQLAITLGVIGLEVQCDSSLIVNHVSGECVTRDSQMAECLQLVLKLKSKISWCDFKWVPRSENNLIGSLANLGATMEFQFRHEIPFEHINNPSIQQLAGEVLCFDTLPRWREPIIAYLKDGTLLDDRIEARKL